jgi:hypothetical protein
MPTLRWLFPLLLLLPSASLFAGDEPGTPLTEAEVRERVPGWIEELRSPSFEVRERARAALEAHAARAEDLLQKHRDDTDPEVRRTVCVILDGLGREAAEPLADPGDLKALGRVSLSAEGKAADLFRILGEGQGARFVLPTPEPEDAIVLAFTDVPFFTGIAQLAAVFGLDASGTFDAAGTLVLRPLVADPESAETPEASNGAFRVRLAEVTATRTLGGAGQRRYQLALDLDWAPSVQLVSYGTPTNLLARTAADARYRPGAAMRSNTTYGVGTGQRRARLTLHLDPPETGEAEEHLEALSFRLPLRLRRDPRRLRLDAALERPLTLGVDGQTAESGSPGSFTLEELDQPDGEQGPWVAYVVARLPGETARRSVQAYLEAADGTLRPTVAGARTQSADGVLRLTLRAYGRWEDPPVAVHVEWFGTEEEGALDFALVGVPLR